jgi:hypothetical protein
MEIFLLMYRCRFCIHTSLTVEPLGLVIRKGLVGVDVGGGVRGGGLRKGRAGL